MDPSVLNAIYKAVKRLSSSAPAIEQAMERVSTIPADLGRVSPNSVARSTLALSPLSDRANWGATVMTPSEFLSSSPRMTDRDLPQIEKLKAQIQQQQLKKLPEFQIDQTNGQPTLQQNGRHRMSALQQLQGDDPVLLNLLQGDQYHLVPQDGAFAHAYEGANTASPLDVLRQQLLAPNGTDLIKINPLWTN